MSIAIGDDSCTIGMVDPMMKATRRYLRSPSVERDTYGDQVDKMFPILNVFADVNGEGRTHHRIDEQSEIFLLFMLQGSWWWWWWRRLYASRTTTWCHGSCLERIVWSPTRPSDTRRSSGV